MFRTDYLTILLLIVIAGWSPAAEPQSPFGKTEDTPQLAEPEYPFAMEGYCPVTLQKERKWRRGDPRFGVIHRRRTFLFATEIEQKAFLDDPDRYTPVLNGCDPVEYLKTGKLVDGQAEFSLTFRRQVWLFADEAALQSFMADSAAIAEKLRLAVAKQAGE